MRNATIRTLRRHPVVGVRPRLEDAVVYYVDARSFQDSDGDGVGDLPGLQRRLGYLRWLGVDALWLSPVYRSSARGAGRAPDPTAIDPRFGTLDDFDGIVRDAHRLGLRVLLDLALGLAPEQRPWFALRARRGARACSVWSEPAPSGGPPTVRLGSAGWTLDASSGQYYTELVRPAEPHPSAPSGERSLAEVLRFWLDRGIDGFRIGGSQRPSPPQEGTGASDVARPWYGRVLRRRPRPLPAPGDATSPARTPGRLDLARAATAWDAATFADAVDDSEAAGPPGGWPALVLGEHDATRLASRVGQDGARLLLALLLTLRGTPVLSWGDELGLPDVAAGAWPPRRRPEARVDRRDRGRTPMPWTAEPRAAGFCSPAARPWLPVPPAAPELSVEAQRRDPASTLWLTRRLLGLRHRHPALRRGSYERTTVTAPGCFAFERRHALQTLLVVANFGPAVTVRVPVERGQLLLASERRATLSGERLQLARCEVAVIAHRQA